MQSEGIGLIDLPSCNPANKFFESGEAGSQGLRVWHHSTRENLNIMPETIDAEKVKATLGKLIDILRDGHEGFTEIGKHIKDESTRLFFLKETQERANFAAELENELHHLGVKDVHQSGMLSGKVHRAWGELKANLGGGDHTLLATAEQGEDVVKKAYKDALAEHLPADIRDLLTRQQAHIVMSHDKVRDLRDAKA